MVKSWLSITQYAQAFNESPHSIRSKVISGELAGKKEGNRWLIEVNENELPLNKELNEKLNPTLIEQLQNQVLDLKRQIEHLTKDNADKNSQINQLLKSQDQSQQIIMSMNQNQKLLAESKRTWIQRLFGLNAESA